MPYNFDENIFIKKIKISTIFIENLSNRLEKKREGYTE